MEISRSWWIENIRPRFNNLPNVILESDLIEFGSKAIDKIKQLQASLKAAQEENKRLREIPKKLLFSMWMRVDNNLDDARSFVGDTALDLRTELYEQNEDKFWDEYEEFKQALKGE